MGILQEVTDTVGVWALTKRGWRMLALCAVCLLVGTAFAVEKLVVYTVYSDRQSFIDRDADNAAAAKQNKEEIELLANRTAVLEKQFIQSTGDMKVIQNDVRWIRETLQRWETPQPVVRELNSKP